MASLCSSDLERKREKVPVALVEVLKSIGEDERVKLCLDFVVAQETFRHIKPLKLRDAGQALQTRVKKVLAFTLRQAYYALPMTIIDRVLALSRRIRCFCLAAYRRPPSAVGLLTPSSPDS